MRYSATLLRSLAGLFQSDHDFDIVGELYHEDDIDELEQQARLPAKAAGKSNNLCYTIYSKMCSDPELVCRHLHSGVLVNIITKTEAIMLATLMKD